MKTTREFICESGRVWLLSGFAVMRNHFHLAAFSVNVINLDRMHFIFGVLKLNSGAVGMIGWKNPGFLSFSSHRIYGLFELAKFDAVK